MPLGTVRGTDRTRTQSFLFKIIRAPGTAARLFADMSLQVPFHFCKCYLLYEFIPRKVSHGGFVTKLISHNMEFDRSNLKMANTVQDSCSSAVPQVLLLFSVMSSISICLASTNGARISVAASTVFRDLFEFGRENRPDGAGHLISCKNS